ncbi:MAG: hypothetical protein KA004_14685 [Verrucomicrobiales bacterium]|nr:hypothetical protein [Verrucomicrobiales bacterium]
MASCFDPPKIALCIGHPGHELHVHGWVRQVQPIAYVLTDGSGPDRQPRIATTSSILHAAGARPGTVYGAFSDRQFYEMILRKDPEPFTRLARKLADGWIDADVAVVAGDMLEGFNTTHDLCRMLINAACEYCRVSGRRAIANFEFPLEGMIHRNPVPEDVVVELPEAAFLAKRQAALEGYPELAADVNRLIAMHGEAPFRREILQAAGGPAGLEWRGGQPPYYERYGAMRIAEGHYHELITHREHIQPIAQALWEWACRGGA